VSTILVADRRKEYNVFFAVGALSCAWSSQLPCPDCTDNCLKVGRHTAVTAGHGPRHDARGCAGLGLPDRTLEREMGCSLEPAAGVKFSALTTIILFRLSWFRLFLPAHFGCFWPHQISALTSLTTVVERAIFGGCRYVLLLESCRGKHDIGEVGCLPPPACLRLGPRSPPRLRADEFFTP
jgi:hypothetical protein